MWWKIGLTILVVAVILVGWGIRRFFRSLLDPCPDETCRGRLKYRGNRIVRGQEAAVYGCDRCTEEVSVSISDEQPAL
ncbi:MAG: hypothetical protein HY567_01345 [Candidatus Kerfeldbacteria bacterium]|nr:hypothetical protein [Candidatus Kerfeldbacteria bacterium]